MNKKMNEKRKILNESKKCGKKSDQVDIEKKRMKELKKLKEVIPAK
jgi:hypothetical protein